VVARDVDHAAERLLLLHREVRELLALAAVGFAGAIGASQLRPDFALPLLVGGVAALLLSMRAVFQRWDLIDRLVLDRDTYAIAEVRRRAEQAASMESRHALASSIHWLLGHPASQTATRVAAARRELEALAAELEDENLALDPACAVACERLVNNATESPLRNPAMPPEDVRSRLRQILGGFNAGSA
jgi:hypothetical protein